MDKIKGWFKQFKISGPDKNIINDIIIIEIKYNIYNKLFNIVNIYIRFIYEENIALKNNKAM